MGEKEVIATQPAISEEQGQDPTQEALVGESEATEVQGIPKKFVGKSVSDVITAYSALESKLGQVASERAQEQKQREELEAKLRELENFQQPSSYAQSQYVTQPKPEPAVVDPFDQFDHKFEEDPKHAIKSLLQQQQEQIKREMQYSVLQQRASSAKDYYERQQKDNPDYVRRDKLMQQLAQRYAHILRPDMLNSIEAFQVLDLMSKGADLAHYEKKAAERIQKDGLSVRDEKKRAQTESSNSAGDERIDFKELSLDEMEKMLPYKED